MAIIRWEPFRMEDFPELRLPKFGSDLAVDVYQDDRLIYAEMNLPGINPDEIDIEVEDDLVRVSGNRVEKKENKEKDYYYQEIQRGSFERTFRLPTRVKAEEAIAEFEDGVLTIMIPKSEQKRTQKIKPKGKKIEQPKNAPKAKKPAVKKEPKKK